MKKLDDILHLGRMRGSRVRLFRELQTQVVVLSLLSSVLFGTYFIYIGARELTLGVGLYAFSLCLWLILRLPRLLTLRLFMVATYLIILLGLTYTGGLQSPDLALLALLPVGAVLLGKKQDVFVAIAAVLITLYVFFLVRNSGVELPEGIDFYFLEQYRLVNYIFAMGFAIIIILLLVVKISRYQVRLVNSVKFQNDTIQKIARNEKFTSLGVITAGIAHEINNPVNFIQMGSVGLSRNVEDLMNYEKRREEHTTKIKAMLHQVKWRPESFAQILNELSALDEAKNEISYDTVLEELSEMIVSIQNGADRTSEIVKEIRSFSQEGSAGLVATDLQQSVDSTLVLLRNQYKYRIAIEKEYEKIPMVFCRSGKIGQVIMNLLINAIQAIENEGTITVRISFDESSNLINLSVSDSGQGILPDIADKVFNPFFTTKPVGDGTGLGLSISKQIVTDHGGTISFKSDRLGTTFTVLLPINNPVDDPVDRDVKKGANANLILGVSSL